MVDKIFLKKKRIKLTVLENEFVVFFGLNNKDGNKADISTTKIKDLKEEPVESSKSHQAMLIRYSKSQR